MPSVGFIDAVFAAVSNFTHKSMWRGFLLCNDDLIAGQSYTTR